MDTLIPACLAPCYMNIDPLRRQIVVEARRLITTRGEQDYGRAIRQAARRLCAGRIPRDRLPNPRELHVELQRTDFDRNAGREPDPIRIDPLWIDVDPLRFDEEPIRDRFSVYRALLAPLRFVRLPEHTHPEGDALYHSLQVYCLVRDRRPFEEELQLAGLLHSVGLAIDPRDPVPATLDVLVDTITERTSWLIEFLGDAHRFREQTLGSRARRRLLAHADMESLETLADCDRQGRMIGMPVPELDDALDELRRLADHAGSNDE